MTCTMYMTHMYYSIVQTLYIYAVEQTYMYKFMQQVGRIPDHGMGECLEFN
jgi:hypothetical protein